MLFPNQKWYSCVYVNALLLIFKGPKATSALSKIMIENICNGYLRIVTIEKFWDTIKRSHLYYHNYIGNDYFYSYIFEIRHNLNFFLS
jgi:hypothetical protein